VNIPDPTTEQVRTNARLDLGDGRYGVAAWYPSMGGYVSHCVIVPDGGCLDVYVWHDGQFPFGDEEPPWPGEPRRSPARLHHCSADSFIGFGKLCQRVMDGEWE
jgi:hypothetical protein